MKIRIGVFMDVCVGMGTYVCGQKQATSRHPCIDIPAKISLQPSLILYSALGLLWISVQSYAQAFW